jgi:tetratricopeptide (TPR) repeat protein
MRRLPLQLQSCAKGQLTGPGLFLFCFHAAKYQIAKLGRVKPCATLGALDAKVKRAESLYSNEQFDEALKLVEGQEFDEHIGALRIRDEVYKRKGDNHASIESLKKILVIDDGDFLTHMKLGNRYFSIGQFESAIIHFQRAEEISPGHPTVKDGLQAARKKLSGGGGALTRS